MKIAVLGYGTVGSGVVEVLEQNQELIRARAGEGIEVKYVLDIRDFPGQKIQEKVVHDYSIILNDEEIEMVVEVMGGVEPAYTFVNQALEAGKHAVTSNKALVAKMGAKLLETAKKNGVNFLFEASVGGGIPIIRTLGECLTADRIEEITGILNGTTNYMLTKMFNEGAAYDAVLKEAQQNGFAEADPTADVEGFDACRKIAILTSIISGKYVEFEDIQTKGISEIDSSDMEYAKKLGMNIKLLAKCKEEGGKYRAFVSPCMLAKTHPLYNVDGVFNAVFVKGNMLGDSMFYGSGAGKLPTASAVCADIVAIAKAPKLDQMTPWTEEKLELADMNDLSGRYFVRVAGTAGETCGIKASQVIDCGIAGEYGVLTAVMNGHELTKAIAGNQNVIKVIRVEA